MFASTVISSHVVLLPVKPPAQGKSRLVGVSDDARRRLAHGFALDTAVACLSTPAIGAVLAVTDDARVAADLAAVGCVAIPDGVSDDLNGTLRLAASEAKRRWPTWQPVALLGDLPALAPEDLTIALSRAPHGSAAFISDADHLGTTLYTAPHELFSPAFGPDSRQRHLDAGAVAIPGPLVTLRRDVDNLVDLRTAAALGLGQHTAAVLAELSLF